ncbi:START domain-containing protein [Vibrio comitans]|uniref:START domain-containing protein n=1 Tax=Vibrio comitans NBRC 102076 TaxID=1219078 RepID=A0A4Y3IN49_9VIBR|nr:START domain-containing protein [Vibrio comitans]GEA60160.1 hypothetical protein VCO01S_13530 [Vibrio comitans NBRC 102076]
MNIKNVIALLVATLSFNAFADTTSWKEVKNSHGITVYNRSIEGSSFKAFRAEMTVESDLTTLMAVFNDVDVGTTWVENVDEMRLVKASSNMDNVTYAMTKAPWPVADRDSVVHNHISQDPETLAVTIKQQAVPDELPRTKNKVRIETLHSTWVFTPISEKETRVTYQVFTEPGGSLPAWLVNKVAISQPYKTFQGLREMSQKPDYQKSPVEGIYNL